MSDPMFAPRGVAVVGASPKPSNLGRRVLEAMQLHGFSGGLAAVNPGYQEVAGVASYPTIDAVPFPVDLVLVFVAAARATGVVEEAADAGAGAVIVFSSGFAETGMDGADEQQRLREVARKRGIRVLGPNCQGLADFRSGLAATFTPAILNADSSACAPVAYVGQSGAVGGVFFDLARERGVTPTAWVSTGNEVDLTVVEAATRLLAAGPLELLCLYLEQVPEGTSWMELTRSAREAGARIAVLRSGSSDSGRRAAASHTGALVGDDRPFDLACELHGVIRVNDISELVELAVACRAGHTPRGRRIAVVTTSGGAGSLAADQAEAQRLSVPVLADETQRRLREVLPAFGAAGNPVDVTADLMVRNPEDLERVCRIVAEDPGVDQVLLAVTNLVGAMADTVAASLTSSPNTPLTMAYLAAPDRIAGPAATMSGRGIPVHPSIRAAVGAMAALSTVGETASHVENRDDPPALPDGAVLTEWAATPLLDWAGVARPEATLVTDPARLPDAVSNLGGCAVLKVQSPEVLHKSELGAVRVGVASGEAADVGVRMLESVRTAEPDATVEGVLVQRISSPGVELLVGVRAVENGYPPTVTVGLGGTTVELYGDVVTAFAPLDVHAAHTLLRQLRGYPLLDGFRGRPRSDVDAAARAVAALSMTATVPGLVEVEVNPLIVHAAGCGATAVDLLVRKEIR